MKVGFLGKKGALIFLFFLVFLSYGRLQAGANPSAPDFLVGTMQKGGTFLIEKFFYMLANELNIPEAKNYNFFHINDVRAPGRISELARPYLRSKKMVIIIRDLRDVAVSYFFFKHRDPSRAHLQNDEEYRHLFFLKLILGEERSSKIQWDLLTKNVEMLKVFSRFDPCIVKFENLIGEQGGGSLMVQVQEIQKICDFLDSVVKKFK